MSLKANTKAVRDYLVTQTMSAWSGVTVSHEPSEATDPLPTAMVNIVGMDISAESVGIDMAQLTFVIAGRFAKVSNLSDAMIDRASDLRVAILSAVNPGNVGYNPYVTRVNFEQGSPLDSVYEVEVTYEVIVQAPRS